MPVGEPVVEAAGGEVAALGPVEITGAAAPVELRRSLASIYIGSAVVGFFILLAIVGPLVVPYDPVKPSGAVLDPPSGAHFFGTDATGFDIFSRVISAARLDLFIGVVSVGLAFAVAAPLGALVGYSEEWWAGAVMRVMDFLQSFPVFVFAMALVAVAGHGVQNIILVLAFLDIPIFLRLVRSEVLGQKRRAFVEAARVCGSSRWRLVMRHILPNAVSSAIAQGSTQVGWALLLTAGLTFVGAGIRPPTAEWGGMIASGAQYMLTGEWWTSVFPGVALALAVLGFALAGEWVQRVLDVRRRQG
jgi:peptide/nickel transport system permease protein